MCWKCSTDRNTISLTSDCWIKNHSKKVTLIKADTHEEFCSRGMLQDHFAHISTHEGALFAPGACSQVFNQLNIVEHFAGWKFCSWGWSIPMKSLVHTEELCSRSVPLEHAPGAKPLVCVGLNRPESCCSLKWSEESLFNTYTVEKSKVTNHFDCCLWYLIISKIAKWSIW